MKNLLVIALLATLLVACGQSGALYLPDKTETKEQNHE